MRCRSCGRRVIACTRGPACIGLGYVHFDDLRHRCPPRAGTGGKWLRGPELAWPRGKESGEQEAEAAI